MKNIEIYAALVAKAEESTANGHKPTRFEMLSVTEEMGIKLGYEAIELVEKLYADGFVNE